MKKVIFFFFIFSFFVLLIPSFTRAGEAKIYISPSSGSFKVEDSFSVDVILDTGGNEVDGVDIHYLHYDWSLLEVQEIKPGNLFANTVVSSVLQNSKGEGLIDFSQTSEGGKRFKGKGVLLTIKFKVLNQGTAKLTFDFEKGKTTDTNVASQGKDILESVSGAEFSLTSKTGTQPSPPPPSPPSPSPLPPSPPTTPPGKEAFLIEKVKTEEITESGAKISWQTEVETVATVYYGPTKECNLGKVSVFKYATSHSLSLSNLKPETTYYFKIEAKDKKGNKVVSKVYSFTTKAKTQVSPPSSPPSPPVPPETSKRNLFLFLSLGAILILAVLIGYLWWRKKKTLG